MPGGSDGSCYRCLRSFKNKFDHSFLDRHVGVELLEYLLNGEAPGFHLARLHASTTLLAHDLQRQSDGQVVFQTDVPVMTAIGEVTAPIRATGPGGRRAIIALSGPLTDGHPADPQAARVRTDCSEPRVIVENELVVRANLPFATRNTMQKIVG